jgi:hypothetical protein
MEPKGESFYSTILSIVSSIFSLYRLIYYSSRQCKKSILSPILIHNTEQNTSDAWYVGVFPCMQASSPMGNS